MLRKAGARCSTGEREDRREDVRWGAGGRVKILWHILANSY